MKEVIENFKFSGLASESNIYYELVMNKLESMHGIGNVKLDKITFVSPNEINLVFKVKG